MIIECVRSYSYLTHTGEKATRGKQNKSERTHARLDTLET